MNGKWYLRYTNIYSADIGSGYAEKVVLADLRSENEIDGEIEAKRLWIKLLKHNQITERGTTYPNTPQLINIYVSPQATSEE